MTWIAVGVGAAGMIAGGIKSSNEKKKQKKIANEIANQKEVPLENSAEGLQVSTAGSDLQKQEQARLNATQIDALAQGGTRAIGVGIGRVNASSQDLNAKIAADLDAQEKDISMFAAQDRGNIRQTKEQRQQAKIAALSSQHNASAQGQAQAEGNMMQGLGMAGGALASSGKLSGTSSVTGKNTGQFSSDKYQIKKSIKDY